MTHPELLKTVERFPQSPGVYLMRDAQGRVLYIGKATNLRNRVRSYFHDTHADRLQIPAMMRKLDTIEWIATHTETEALILEANLIRTHKPPYNVDLKDDKRYPYLKVTVAEPFPRLLVTRRVENDGSEYFGPYTDARAMRRIMRFAKRIFGIRDCNRKLPLPRPMRPCINYSMGRCSGACAGKIDQETYRRNVSDLIEFLRGRRNGILEELRTRMQHASERLDFENAALYRDQLQLIENASKAQRVDLALPAVDCDAFGIYMSARSVCLAVLHFREGLLISRRRFAVSRRNWDMSAAARDAIVLQFYMSSAQDIPKEVLLSPDAGFAPTALENWFKEEHGRRVRVAFPHRGSKRRLVEMAEKNARLYLAEKMPHEPSGAVLQLQEALGLPAPPQTIEAFDISNLGEAFAVAAMVHFRNGSPLRSAYRRYKIKTVESQNDFAMMMEVVTRRLRRLSDEDKAFPDLLLIDGGKGQLGAARKALAQFEKPPMLVSLAKKEETLFSPYREEGVELPASHPARKLAQHIRDEAHRWAVSYHRKLRGKQFRRSSLEDIPGIGPSTARKLLKAFGSVRRAARASPEEIARIRGFSWEKALKLKKALEHV